MNKLQQTLVVGLGRSGRVALEHLKRRIEQTYGELPAIKLLAFDVQGNTTGPGDDQTNLGPTELLQLPWEDNHAAIPLSRADARQAWHHNIEALYSFLIAQLDEIGSATTWQAMEAKGFEMVAERNEANLIVLAALGEAAGGGLLFDVTYLFDQLFRTAGLQCASSAILFMPPLSQPDSAADARAYATLKELNAYMGGAALYRCAYAGLSVQADTPPFNRGCYLIDTRNEKALTLKDIDEAARLAGEWVFRTALTPLKGRVDEFAPGAGMSPRVQGQPAVYNSFGLAAYVLPIERLLRWSTARRSEELITEQLLKPELFARVADRLGVFFNQTHLRPDDLINNELRRDKDGKPIKLQSDAITHLKTLPHDQIVGAVQATINAIGKEMLPGSRSQIDANTRRIVQEAGDMVDHEAAAVLRQWPVGGLSLAVQLVSRLRDDALRFADSLTRREAAYQGRNQQQVNFLARQGPMLKNAIASIPPWRVGLIALLGGVLAPLLLVASLLEPLGVARNALVAGVAVLALGGVAWALWQSIGRVSQLRDQYVTYLQNRFETELSLMLVQAAHRLYPEVANAAADRLSRLNEFSERLHLIARQLKQGLNTASLCGEIDFSLQRSVLTPELLETVYQDHLSRNAEHGMLRSEGAPSERGAPVPGANGASEEGEERGVNVSWSNIPAPQLQAMLDTYGTLDTWVSTSMETLRDRIFYCVQEGFEPLRELRVEALMQAPGSAAPPEAERLARDLLDKAAPLCVYNVYNLGPAPTISEQTFVGFDAAQGELAQAFQRVNPTIAFESLHDRHSLAVTTVRRGIPLFGLVRVAELRRNYLDAVRASGSGRAHGRPGAALQADVEALHLDDELALASDLQPFITVERQPLEPALVFALGVALGIIQPRADDGVYVAVDDQGLEVASFAREPVASAILLGADDKMLAVLDGWIQAAVAERGAGEMAASLEAYARQPQVSTWERRRIERYVRLLRG